MEDHRSKANNVLDVGHIMLCIFVEKNVKINEPGSENNPSGLYTSFI